MEITCPSCAQKCEVEEEPMAGQHLLCPFCGVKFNYTPQEVAIDNVRGKYAVNGEGEQKRTESSAIKITCPYCGAGYEVDASYEGEIATCGTCDKKFVVQVANEKQADTQEKSNASAPRKKVMRKFVLSDGGGISTKKQVHIAPQCNIDAAQNGKKQNARGCLPVALFFLSWFFVAIFHNWVSVAVSVTCAFTAIMMCVYNRLYTQMDGQTTIGDVFKRLGIGGVSISLLALTFSCVFLMHSCSHQAGEEEFERELRAKRRRDEVERNGGWEHYQECKDCHYRNVFWIRQGEDPYMRQFQCSSCGHWMKYNLSIW